jgi:hypothetical protein
MGGKLSSPTCPPRLLLVRPRDPCPNRKYALLLRPLGYGGHVGEMLRQAQHDKPLGHSSVPEVSSRAKCLHPGLASGSRDLYLGNTPSISDTYKSRFEGVLSTVHPLLSTLHSLLDRPPFLGAGLQPPEQTGKQNEYRQESRDGNPEELSPPEDALVDSAGVCFQRQSP